MSVLFQVHNLCKSYGARTILNDATASFSRHQKIGLIGRNGTGKSTLCRIITGEEEADSGHISKNSDLRLSYLEQHDPYKVEELVADFLQRYSGREEWECGEMAGRFQIKHDMLYSPISSLSGGYRTRVKLTAMLLKEPNFLILDEPTNYLDLSTLLLLENFLNEFKGGFLIVSHDREFLKRTCTSTLEVENGKLSFYPGDIENYFVFKEEQKEQVEAYNKGVESKKKQLQDFVDRFKARASTATRAKSKMRQIEKLHTIEVVTPMATINIRIPQIEPKGGVALFCQDMSIGYPQKDIASGINFDIDRGQRVAVLGDNGQGKTTFLKTLTETIPVKGGSYKWGTGLKIACYAQHVFQTLNPAHDIYSHLVHMAAPGVSNQDILDLAGCFLFKGDDVRKKVGVLSGGERARVILAGLLLTKSHVLLLDEPTNHLDFETVEALGKALKDFAGTIFFISHDRTFVNMVATSILEVKGGKIRKFPASYEEYVYMLEKEMAEDLMKEGYGPRQAAPKPKGDEKSIQAEINKVQSRMKKAEDKMTALKEEQEKLMEEFAKNPAYSREKKERYDELTLLLQEAEADWMEYQEELDELTEK